MCTQNNLSELDLFTQNSIDEIGWRGTLMDIRDALPSGKGKDRIEEMIKLIQPQKTMKDAIAVYGLENIIRCLLDNDKVNRYNPRPCPEKIKQKLSEFGGGDLDESHKPD